MKLSQFRFLCISICAIASCTKPTDKVTPTSAPQITKVTVNDSFWSPKLELWQRKTVKDVFDKFEGKYKPEGEQLERDFKALGETRNAFTNFDLVAQGKRGIGKHHGPPWYDGLIYETIRGTADLLALNPDPKLEQRIDGYIDRIVAAQESEPSGYLNTYTQLMEPDHMWGFNGGMERWQHDVYNAGAMVEAGIHYYKATGKTKLLSAAVKYANFMYQEMGPAPKKNVVPSHSGPEEMLIKLYKLFKDEPELEKKLGISVNEDDYFDLAKFWIDSRGHHAGLPLWRQWGDERSEAWVRANEYADPKYGNHSRPSWGDYAQDSIPVLEQTTIEGHAVRATLLATGLTTAAIENGDEKYAQAARRLWDNMTGRRMFITGGVGAIARDEKFGDDFFLPNDAYLETCAAVGAGFFSQRMNQLTHDGKYMDEFERVLYNNVLTGISQSGDQYTYVNPLVGAKHYRWQWHDCPCCPPMFLKMVGAVPGFIYAADTSGVTVNLFISSQATIQLPDNKQVQLSQQTQYPWQGEVVIKVDVESPQEFVINVRIPGWARGVENPFGLYESTITHDGPVTVRVNDDSLAVNPVDGYARIRRTWKRGDQIALYLPVLPRRVRANKNASDLKGLVAISAGPVVYCLEENFNSGVHEIMGRADYGMDINFDSNLLGGVNVITGAAGDHTMFTAIPYFAAGNIKPGQGYRVWVKEK